MLQKLSTVLNKNVEAIVHLEVQKLYPDAQLPTFTTLFCDENHLILKYQSKKKLDALARNLKSIVREKTKELRECVKIVDQNIIISSTDEKGIIAYAREAFCKITGFSKEELIGKSHKIIRHPDTPKSLFKSLWNTVKNGIVWHNEIKNKKKDGNFFWADVIISPKFETGQI